MSEHEFFGCRSVCGPCLQNVTEKWGSREFPTVFGKYTLVYFGGILCYVNSTSQKVAVTVQTGANPFSRYKRGGGSDLPDRGYGAPEGPLILGCSRKKSARIRQGVTRAPAYYTPYLKDAILYRRNGSQGSQDHLHLDQRLADVVIDCRTLAKTVSTTPLTLR